jgi:hypothetical protein
MNKDQIIETAVKAALEWHEKQLQKQNKSRHDRRLRNTRLLLRNYSLLKDHCQKSVYNLQQIPSGNAIDVLDAIENMDGTAYIESIQKSVTKTFIIISHIDTMLELYEIYCQRSQREEDQRRYRILKAYYFEGCQMSEIIEREHIEERTYYRDMRESISKLSALIFGIDSLHDVS